MPYSTPIAAPKHIQNTVLLFVHQLVDRPPHAEFSRRGARVPISTTFWDSTGIVFSHSGRSRLHSLVQLTPAPFSQKGSSLAG